MKFIHPMLCYLGTTEDLQLPNYMFEPKLDGFRALCYVQDGTYKLISRNGNNMTDNFPELHNVAKQIKATDCILDGELVVYDDKGVPSFELLQNHFTPNVIKVRAAVYIVFDVLSYNGKSYMQEPIEVRKKLLNKIVKENNYIQIIPVFDESARLWKAVQLHKLEGVIAKKIGSVYNAGARSRDWIKIKIHDNADCIIIGFTQQKRNISSLLLGMYDAKGELIFVGKVGTGFSEDLITALYKKFKPLITTKPTVEGVKHKEVVWLKPKLVAEIKFAEWTRNRRLRSPVFLRLRTDKPAKECVYYTT